MAITLDGTTGVTAAEFDGAIDASNLTGVLPALDGSALTGIDTAPPTDFGAVGTYSGFSTNSTGVLNTTFSAGTTYAGSSLQKQTGPGTNQFEKTQVSALVNAGVSGTWRLMADFTTNTSTEIETGSLYVRIA